MVLYVLYIDFTHKLYKERDFYMSIDISIYIVIGT